MLTATLKVQINYYFNIHYITIKECILNLIIEI